MTDLRCADASEAAGEQLGATATTAHSWLLVEVPGTWPRDVAEAAAGPDRWWPAVREWLERTPRSRLLFVRRPGRRTGDERAAFVVHATEERREVRRLTLAADGDTVDLDTAGEPVDTGLVLVCGHGSRDACCAVRGTAVYRELAERVPSDALWLSSHQGGHRFAANVLVLPQAVQLGRVPVSEAASVVEEVLAGRIPLAHYRGRTSYTARDQAAERVVRESTGIVELDGLTLRGDDGRTVGFVDESGGEYAATVEDGQDGPTVPASCGVAPEPQPSLRALLA